MALTPQELAAVNTLNSTTGGDYPGDPGGLGNDGHRVNFVPAVQAVATVGQAAAREAGAAASAAATASGQAAALSGTSTTSIAISAGSKTLTTQSGKAFSPGTFLLLTSNASPTTHYIFGQVTSYSGASLSLNVTSFSGSGSRADWTIRVAGGPGVQGGVGPAPTLSIGAVTDGPTADADVTGSDGVYALDLTLPRSTVPGPPGAQILNGARDPLAGDGNNGDYWMQSADGATGLLGDYWAKSGGTWTKLFNTRGPSGSGSGDMTGPNGGVVDGEIALFSGTSGKAAKGSGLTIADIGSGSGTVTSIDIEPAGGSGLVISGGPITEDGTLEIGWDGGYQAYTTIEAQKLAALVNPVNADWNATNGLAEVLNKPSIPSAPEHVGAEPAGRLVGINTQTGAAYTLALSDAGRVVERSNANANSVTVPANGTVAFPVNTRIDIVQTGAGQTTIVAAGGVTVRSEDNKLALAKQYSGASLYKRAVNEWVLIGSLA